jgi:hypothetical protein
MPYRTTRTHRQHHEVVRDLHVSRLASRLFDSSYLATNAYQEKYAYAGMIVALDSATSKYVPYSVAASYGTGSDTAIGLLVEPEDMTWGDKAIAPAWHFIAVEQYCFVYGSAIGTIPAAVKTALDNSEWT